MRYALGIGAVVFFLLAVAGLLVYSVVGPRRRRRRRGAAYAAVAAARGWSYEDRGSGWTGAFTIPPFRRAARRRAETRDVLTGMLSGHRAVCMLYRYSRGTNPDNLNEVWRPFTVCAVQLPPDLAGVDPARKSFEVDRGSEMVRRVMSRRRLAWCVDGNWLVCWERGTRASVEEVLARLEVLAAIVDGRAGRIRVG